MPPPAVPSSPPPPPPPHSNQSHFAPLVRPREWRTRGWMWLIATVLLVLVVWIQRPTHLSAAQLADLQDGTVVEPPGLSPEIAISKVVIAYTDRKLWGMDISGLMRQQLDPPPVMPGMPAPPPKFAQDRFRTALVVAKLGDKKSMNERFEGLSASIAPKSPLHEDIQTARAIVDGQDVDPKKRDDLLIRHGWFGRLLIDDGAPGGVLETAKSDGERFVSVLVTAMAVMIVLVGAGIVSLVVMAGMFMSRTARPFPTSWRSEPGSPDSSGLWLEMVAIFLAGFLALKLVVELLALGVQKNVITWISLDHLLWLSLAGQWLLVATLFWPRIRGLSGRQHRLEVGWHRGRGVMREIGAGVFSYLTILPIYILMAIVVAIAMLAYYSVTKQQQPMIDNKVMDLAAGGTAELVAVFLLATVWAPLVEETIFRGALYRVARPRGGVICAALISAAVFAVLHAYLIPQLVLVGVLGFCFALMREWRGSLIGSIIAHAIHNGLVLTFVASLAPIMRG